jgi:hypothetical protein
VGPREPFEGTWEALVGQGASLLARIESNWQRWDALWYQHIATFGYSADDDSVAFYPLYPLVSRVFSFVSGDIVRAELFVSAAASIVAAWLLWKLTRLEVFLALPRDRTERRPRRQYAAAPVLTVLLLVLFPTGFFLLAPYTESLFLCLTVASFWLMRTGHLWAAGVVALFASLTRPQGIFLALPIAYEALRAGGPIRWDRVRRMRRPGIPVGASLLPVVGALAFAFFQSSLVAPGQIALGSQAPWGFTVVMPWDALSASLDYVARTLGKPKAILEALNLASIGAALLVTMVGVRRIPLAYSLYAIPMLALYPFRMMAFSPLMSVSRYVLVVFPWFMVAGLWFAGRPRLAIVWLVASAIVQLALFQYWVRWGFVS